MAEQHGDRIRDSSGYVEAALIRAARPLRDRVAAVQADPQVGLRASNFWLERWRTQCDALGENGWGRRLAEEQLDSDTAAGLADDGERGCVPSEAPAWFGFLRSAVIGEAATACQVPGLEPGGPLAEIPFIHVIAPVIAEAERLLSGSAGAWTRLAPSVRNQLRRALAWRLGGITEPTLESEFDGLRAPPGGQEGSPPAKGAPRTAAYDRFVSGCLAPGNSNVFRRYPVLARLLGTVAVNWVDATAEFLGRLEADRPFLEQAFGSREAGGLGAVVSLKVDLSDPHCGGRAVAIVGFERGQVVYKPRDLSAEAAFGALQGWVNSKHPSILLRVPRLVLRNGYGWMEWITDRPVEDEAAVARYYARVGSLMALLVLVDGTDIHFENLISCGEHPQLIDLEAILHQVVPPPSDAPAGSAMQVARLRLLHSPANTGLLPDRHESEGGRAEDVSGLAAGDLRVASVSRWVDVNTDSMRRIRVPSDPDLSRNIPSLGGRPAHVRDHFEALVGGYAATHRLLRAHKPELLAPDGPIRAFRGITTRFVIRPTRVYWKLQQRAIDPAFLGTGLARSVELDRLASATFRQQLREGSRLLAVEHGALENMDIPVFRVMSDESDLLLDDGSRIEAFFGPESAFDRLLLRVRGLDDAGERLDLAIIRGLFLADGATDSGNGSADGGASVREARVHLPETGVPAREIVEPGRLRHDAAARIADHLVGSAILGGVGSRTWIGMDYSERTMRPTFNVLGYDLYSGVAGIGLFLATCHRVLGVGEHRETALGAMRNFAMRVEHRERLGAELSVGGFTGIGGIVHALAAVSSLIGEPELLDLAGEWAGLLSAQRLAADDQHDVLNGNAGAVLALLAIHEATRESRWLDVAIGAGCLLIDRQVATPGGGAAWKTDSNPPLTGFSHGAAGIAFALERLQTVTGDPRFSKPVALALEFERAAFDQQVGNWSDFRAVAEGVAPMVAWCNGATGIGLGRLGTFRPGRDARRLAEIEAAVQATLSVAESPDFLCCGEAGRIDFLLEAAAKLGREDLREAALKRSEALAAAVMGEAPGSTSQGLRDGTARLGLQQGIAGLGYALLRAVAPEQVPCLLRLEVAP